MSKIYLKRVGVTTLKKWCIYYGIDEKKFKETMMGYDLSKFTWFFGKHVNKKIVLGSKIIMWSKIIIRDQGKYMFPKTVLMFTKSKKVWLDEYDWKRYISFIKWARSL